MATELFTILVMKSLFTECTLALLLLGGMTMTAPGQSAKDDIKDAGRSTKQVAKDAGKATEKTAKKDGSHG
jgi:hypothetical protein